MMRVMLYEAAQSMMRSKKWSWLKAWAMQIARRRGKGLGADSEEKREPVGDIDIAVVDSLKVLDPRRPIREADMSAPPSLEFSPDAGRRREAQVAARNDRFAPAIAFQLLGLPLFGAGIDVFRRQKFAEFGFTLSA